MGRDRDVPAEYATQFVELAYATTVHGAQGETVDHAHVAVGETTGAAAAYVAMTRSSTTSPRPGVPATHLTALRNRPQTSPRIND